MTKSIDITLIRMIDVMKNGMSRPLMITGLIAMFLMGACDPAVEPNEAQLEAEDSESVQSDAMEDFYFDDSDDLSDEALDSEFSINGKSKTDERLACATITRTGDDTNGSVTISFGNGCTDPRGRVRRGSLVIEYAGRRGTLGALWRLTFVDYFIDGVKLEGTRTVTNTIVGTNSSEFEVRLDEGRAIFPDGRIAKRKVNRRRIHERDENNLLDRLIIYGTEEGNHRNGRGFYIEILEPLVYDRECFKSEGVIIPVSGKKLIKHGERQITVDYGDGKCDNLVTITNKNGRTWEYTVD